MNVLPSRTAFASLFTRLPMGAAGLTALTALLVLAGPAHAQQQEATVEGQVTDQERAGR